MFNNTTGQIGDTPKACKVDPEEMLQQARSGLECIIKAQMLIQEITELPIYFEQMETEKALLTLPISHQSFG